MCGGVWGMVVYVFGLLCLCVFVCARERERERVST